MKSNRHYICKIPLALPHTYVEPFEDWTIDESWGEWYIDSKNVSKNSITLRRLSGNDSQTKVKITVDIFNKHFAEKEYKKMDNITAIEVLKKDMDRIIKRNNGEEVEVEFELYQAEAIAIQAIETINQSIR